jgi:hypothetical protein
MQLLILNANSIIWGVGKSRYWNHMKKHLEIFFLKVLWGNKMGEKHKIEKLGRHHLQRGKLVK